MDRWQHDLGKRCRERQLSRGRSPLTQISQQAYANRCWCTLRKQLDLKLNRLRRILLSLNVLDSYHSNVETYLVSYNFHPRSDNWCQQYDLIGRHMWGYKRGHVCQDKTGTHVACSQQVASETLKNERHAKWRQTRNIISINHIFQTLLLDLRVFVCPRSFT